MSSALAIASVTAVLKDLLDNAIINHSVGANVGGTVTVTALAPDRIETGERESAQLNLFLYHITPNPGWRNVGLPSRDEYGERLTNPPLALDLYYLLMAYGKQDLETEILLGYAAQLLHDTPVLTRDAIRKALAPPSPVDAGILPPAMQALVASDLADQVELIKISPHTMTTEEISKLWTAFQTKYRTSVAFHVSVVLIESKYPARSPLPVLTRGQPDPVTGRDQGVTTQPSLVPPYPTLQEAIPPDHQTAVRMGETLTLRGHHLDGAVTARFTHTRSSDTLELPVSIGATSIECQVQTPPDPAPGPVTPDSPQNPDNWQAGIYSVTTIIQRAGQSDRTANELPVTLAPRIKSITSSTTGGEVTLTVECSPKVWKTQQVTLVVSDHEIPVDPITQEKTDTLTFKSSSLPSGSQWVRLRVDGIDSILIDKRQQPPTFDPTQKVTI
jgi:hypothetical protein